MHPRVDVRFETAKAIACAAQAVATMCWKTAASATTRKRRWAVLSSLVVLQLAQK